MEYWRFKSNGSKRCKAWGEVVRGKGRGEEMREERKDVKDLNYLLIQCIFRATWLCNSSGQLKHLKRGKNQYQKGTVKTLLHNTQPKGVHQPPLTMPWRKSQFFKVCLKAQRIGGIWISWGCYSTGQWQW